MIGCRGRSLCRCSLVPSALPMPNLLTEFIRNPVITPALLNDRALSANWLPESQMASLFIYANSIIARIICIIWLRIYTRNQANIYLLSLRVVDWIIFEEIQRSHQTFYTAVYGITPTNDRSPGHANYTLSYWIHKSASSSFLPFLFCDQHRPVLCIWAWHLLFQFWYPSSRYNLHPNRVLDSQYVSPIYSAPHLFQCERFWLVRIRLSNTAQIA